MMRERLILEQFYMNRNVRVYKEYSPTLRSERFGLLVLEDNKTLIGAGKMITLAESLEERPIDRDYNVHGGQRITQPEILGGVLLTA